MRLHSKKWELLMNKKSVFDTAYQQGRISTARYSKEMKTIYRKIKKLDTPPVILKSEIGYCFLP